MSLTPLTDALTRAGLRMPAAYWRGTFTSALIRRLYDRAQVGFNHHYRVHA